MSRMFFGTIEGGVDAVWSGNVLSELDCNYSFTTEADLLRNEIPKLCQKDFPLWKLTNTWKCYPSALHRNPSA